MDEKLNTAVQAVAAVQETIERESRQPRFQNDDESRFSFARAVARWVYKSYLTEPKFTTDTRKYDHWLVDFAQYEPHLHGVLKAVVDKDRNRGWTLTGGVRQVARFTERLRFVENGQGWRKFMTKQATSFYNTNMGAVTELERESINGALWSMYHVDPTRCRIDLKEPLRYYPKGGKMQKWQEDEFFRTVAMPDIREDYQDIGFCAINRCLSLAKMMVATYEHILEQLQASPAKGFLTGDNITMNQFETAVQRAVLARENGDDKYDPNIIALFSEAAGKSTNINFTSLSQWPEQMDLRQFTDIMMYAYALAFGYDAAEFYPVQSGAFGRGGEANVQAEKASYKGERSFTLSFQDNLQLALPESLLYEFDNNDPKGDLSRVAVQQAKANLVNSLSQWINVDEARYLLVEQGIIPAEWTEAEEQTMADQNDRARDNIERSRLRNTPNIMRAAMRYPDEPIVRYQWPTGTIVPIWKQARDVIQRIWGGISVTEKPAKMQSTLRLLSNPSSKSLKRAESGTILFYDADKDIIITDGDIDKAIGQGESYENVRLTELLKAEVS